MDVLVRRRRRRRLVVLQLTALAEAFLFGGHAGCNPSRESIALNVYVIDTCIEHYSTHFSFIDKFVHTRQTRDLQPLAYLQLSPP